jgi:phosphoglycerol geranylgeranyltransferase
MLAGKNIYHTIETAVKAGRKLIAVLIDPDKADETHLKKILLKADEAADLILVGGSLLTSGNITASLQFIKKNSTLPVFIFPGNAGQVSREADGIFLLSLISGRNPEFLIGQHVQSAYSLKKSGLEIIPTGYILIDGGKPSAVSYMSNTAPVPADKPEIAVSTAIAGELLGLQLIYLEAGSGALFPVRPEVIERVKKNVTIPVFVGGGINSLQRAEDAFKAGADAIVIGNVLEEDPAFLSGLLELKKVKSAV